MGTTRADFFATDLFFVEICDCAPIHGKDNGFFCGSMVVALMVVSLFRVQRKVYKETAVRFYCAE